MKLEPKSTGPGAVSGQYWATDKDRKWSVVDLAALMSTAPISIEKYREMGMFLGWEAAEEIDNKLNFDNLLRAESWEELKKLLV